MSEHVPLILHSAPVGRLAGGPPLRPGVAVVYTGTDGRVLGEEGRPLDWRTRMQARQRFEVDVTDHQSSFRYELPSHGDVFYFACTMDVSWRVTRPWEVVARGINDGYTLLFSRLLDELPPITRKFDPEDVGDAEGAINQRFGHKVVHLYEGLTIHRCFARLRIDATKRDHALERSTQAHGATLEARRIEAIRSVADGDASLITLHLAKHPEDTAKVVDLVAANRKVDLETRTALFDRLVESGVLQDVDLEALRDQLLTPISEMAAPSRRAIGGGAPPAGARESRQERQRDAVDLPDERTDADV